MSEIKFKNFSGATKAKVLAAGLGITGAGAGIGYLRNPLDKKIEGTVKGGIVGGAIAGLHYLGKKGRLNIIRSFYKEDFSHNERLLRREAERFKTLASEFKRKHGIDIPIEGQEKLLNYKVLHANQAQINNKINDMIKNFKGKYDPSFSGKYTKSTIEKMDNNTYKDAKKAQEVFDRTWESTFPLGNAWGTWDDIFNIKWENFARSASSGGASNYKKAYNFWDAPIHNHEFFKQTGKKFDQYKTKYEVTTDYRNLMRKNHPDVNPGDPLAHERAKKINAAYKDLKSQDWYTKLAHLIKIGKN